MKKSKFYQSPNSPEVKEVKEGYSFTVCFFGIIPMLFRKDFLTAFICVGIAFLLNILIPINLFFYPSYIFYFIIGFFYNDYYGKKLIKNGYTIVKK